MQKKNPLLLQHWNGHVDDDGENKVNMAGNVTAFDFALYITHCDFTLYITHCLVLYSLFIVDSILHKTIYVILFFIANVCFALYIYIYIIFICMRSLQQ